MKIYLDINYGRTRQDPLQVIVYKDGKAEAVNKNNNTPYDASKDYIDYRFSKIDLDEVTIDEANVILQKWGFKPITELFGHA